MILAAGGRWDLIDRRFIDQEPESCKVIDLEESQIEFTSWFATWLRDYREGFERDTSLVLAGGERRGGKTFDLQVCTIATGIDVPDTIGWLICEGFREREEIHQLIVNNLPDHWYRERRAPDYRYDFRHGSTLRVQSSTDPNVLKQGRADVVFLNEGQKMRPSALVNALGGTIDRGGIGLVAANPPQSARGEWVLELKEAIDEGRVAGARFFGFSAELNTRVDQAARGRFRSIVSTIDPHAAAADAEGAWNPIGDIAYPNFKRREHVRALPEIGNITERFIYGKSGYKGRFFLNGADFQIWPFNAGISLGVFGGREDGKPIFYVVAEMLREGSESEFLDTVEETGVWVPENTLWIGDASGTWQDGAHQRGRTSFDVFRERRWLILPPQKKKTNKGEHPSNPSRADRLSLVNNLLAQNRLFIAGMRQPDGTMLARCPELEQALKKCQLKDGRPVGKYAHITDALGYTLWWAEPRPRAKVEGIGILGVKISRRGSDFY